MPLRGICTFDTFVPSFQFWCTRMPRKKNCSRGVTISGKASLALDRSPIEVLITSTVSETPLPTMTQLLIGWPLQLFIFRDYF